MRHYMTDPDEEERLLKIPANVVAVIKAEAYAEAREAVCNRIHKHEMLTAIDALRKGSHE